MIGNFVIFGDSYSTHKEYIPEGYAYYYSTEGDDDNPVKRMTPEETWWWKLIERTDGRLVHNNSWSGSTIGYNGYSGDCSTSSSFIYRYNTLYENGFFEENKIDTIFIFGGTNDSWSETALGEMMLDGWERDDLYRVLPAVSYIIYRVKTDGAAKRVVFIANCDIKDEIVECARAASEHFNVEFVRLKDIDKQSGHPTPFGMTAICEQIIRALGE